MTDKHVTARNTISGVVGSVPASYLEHPVFGKQLVEVEETAKSYVPELYKSKSAEEFEARKAPEKVAPKPAPPLAADTNENEEN